MGSTMTREPNGFEFDLFAGAEELLAQWVMFRHAG